MNTTNKLRHKIMALMMILLSFTLILILVATNILNYKKITSEMNDVLEYYLSEKMNEDQPSPPPKANSAPESENKDSNTNDAANITPKMNLPKREPSYPKYKTSAKDLKELIHSYSLIYIKCSNSKEYEHSETNRDDTSSYSEDTLKKYSRELLNRPDETGTIDSLKYLKQHSFHGYHIVLMDSSIPYRSFRSFLVTSLILGLLGLLVFIFLSYLISCLIVRPVEKVFQQQKDFISAASHELKTPLTIIQANSELLSDQYGDSKWLSYIQSECLRMGNLVTSLLTLCRLDQNESHSKYFQTFSFSDCILERLLPFESIAFEKNIRLDYSIEPDLSFHGIREEIQQLFSILLDNAFYYTKENGTIQIDVKKMNHQLQLSVANTGISISKEDQQRIFQRFYRVDKARSRSDGHFGLGLPIAKDIVEKHKGNIKVHCENGITTFLVMFHV